MYTAALEPDRNEITPCNDHHGEWKFFVWMWSLSYPLLHAINVWMILYGLLYILGVLCCCCEPSLDPHTTLHFVVGPAAVRRWD